jgi:uncharacterized protein YciI
VTLFAVLNRHAGAYDHSRPLNEQPCWAEHAAFMNALADDGFVLLGGPLEDGGPDVLLVVEATGEAEIRERLDPDPWVRMGLLETARVAPWRILLGEPPAAPARSEQAG